MLPTIDEVETRLLAAAPGAAERARAARGGARRRSTRCCSTRCRSRSTAAAEPPSPAVVPCTGDARSVHRKFHLSAANWRSVRAACGGASVATAVRCGPIRAGSRCARMLSVALDGGRTLRDCGQAATAASSAQRFRSQTSRSPWSVSSGSTSVIVRECGAIRLGEAARCDHRRVGRAELVADRGRRSRRPGRRSRRRGRTGAPSVVVLPITRSGAVERHLRQPRGAREQRVHRDLDPRREHAADVLARRRDDVEVRRGAEVDHDRGRAVALARRDRVRDPVGPDLARVVVADRHAGRDARAEHEQLGARPALGEATRTRATSCGTVDESTIPSSASSSTNARSITASSSAGVRGIGADAELVGEPVAVEQAEDGLRVADVDREQHRGRGAARSGARASSSCARSLIRFASASAVSVGSSSPSPFSSSTVTSAEV